MKLEIFYEVKNYFEKLIESLYICINKKYINFVFFNVAIVICMKKITLKSIAES